MRILIPTDKSGKKFYRIISSLEAIMVSVLKQEAGKILEELEISYETDNIDSIVEKAMKKMEEEYGKPVPEETCLKTMSGGEVFIYDIDFESVVRTVIKEKRELS